MKRFQVGVIGSAGPEEYEYDKPNNRMYRAAEEVGGKLAEANTVIICGGKGGVMEAVAKGAKAAGGITVAETSGLERFSANKYIDVEVVTGDVAFRGPSQLIAMSDAVIVIGGGAGTLQEICVAYRMAKPIVLLKGYGGWTDRLTGLDWLDERKTIAFHTTQTAAEAVKLTLSLLQSITIKAKK